MFEGLIYTQGEGIIQGCTPEVGNPLGHLKIPLTAGSLFSRLYKFLGNARI